MMKSKETRKCAQRMNKVTTLGDVSLPSYYLVCYDKASVCQCIPQQTVSFVLIVFNHTGCGVSNKVGRVHTTLPLPVTHPASPLSRANRAALLSDTTCIIFPFSRPINGPHSYKYMLAAFRCILVGGLNVYINHYFKYIGTLKTVGGWRWRTEQTLYSNIFRTKEKPGGKRGWRLSGGRLSWVLLYLQIDVT